MKRIVLFSVLVSLFFFWSCKKDQIPEDNTNENIPTTMDELNVPPSFNWSASVANALTVTLNHDPEISVEGQILLLLNEHNLELAKSIIKNDQAIFNIKLPSDIGVLYLFYPNTANKQKFDIHSAVKGGASMYVAPQPRVATKSGSGLDYDHKLADVFFNNGLYKIPRNAKGQNLVQNPYFDQNNLGFDGRSWTKLRSPGKWYYTNSNSTAVTTNVNGNMVFKNTTSGYDVIEQSFPVLGGSTYNFSMIFSGSINLWLDNFNANGQWIGETHVVTNGNKITSSGTILPNATHFQFYIGLNHGAWVDSVIYISTNLTADSDGDGINNNADDYPNDSTKAFDIYYPTVGYQTVSFEDLWPSKGDYDFNDIVVSAKTHYIANADGDYVEAAYSFSLDACGSSLPSGLGINILDINKNNITNQVIDSVTGYGTKDPAVSNGAIVYSNHFNAMSHYYTNTSTTQNTGTPEQFNLRIKFKDNAKTAAPDIYLSDFYYFDSNTRGREIHMPNFPPTAAASSSFFGTYNDDANNHYRTSTGLPWAIEVVTANKTYKHPLEKIPITMAYSQFAAWAASQGSNNTTWYDNATSGKTFNGN
jgi:LruC domain-containing protein